MMNQEQNNFNEQGAKQSEDKNNLRVKSKKKGKIIIFIGFILIIIGGGITLYSSRSTKNNDTDNSDTIIESSDNNNVDTLSSEITKYWNIDTGEFDASLFDGKFSIAGNVIQSKLTGKTLKDNGYELRIGSGFFDELLWDQDNNVYSDKSNGVYILKNNEELVEDASLYNYKNETSLESDNTEVSYYWNDNVSTYRDIIFPASLITNLEDNVGKTLTIDNVVDKLGAPTYVQGRLTKNIEDKQFFSYVYVYDDYTLWFEMVYYEKTGITMTGYSYEGNQSFNQPCKYYDAELDEFRNYNNNLEYLEEEQTKYEKTL